LYTAVTPSVITSPRIVMPRQLDRYRGKRSPGATNEPFEEESSIESPATLAGAYVVHLHDATRKHYDVRLEFGGVLLSFAVPHGPSLDPTKKALAVRTEEHPIEYLEFEDVIPEGQYGAGPMIAWDRGQVTYVEGPAEQELATGKLHVELRGMKLRGRWAFVKLAKGETGNEWLLFKKQDEYANPSRDIIAELPRSVLSGLTIDELDQREAIARAHVERAKKLGARVNAKAITDLAGHPAPLADTTANAPVTRAWLYDAELDGVRVLAVRDDDVVTLRVWGGDRAANVEAFYPDVVRALRALPITRVAVDGELVAFDATGRPSLSLLAQRVKRIAEGDTHRALTTIPVVLVVTDLLALDDLDTRPLPIESRRALVSALVPSLGFLRAAEPLMGVEAHVISSCAALGIAGVIAKPKGSPYANGLWSHRSTGVAPRKKPIVDHRADIQKTLRQVKVTNRDKIFWPEDGYTKGDLVDYYTAVADVLCPYLKDRPVILVRYPDGIHGKNFFQWRVPPGMPAWVRTMTISSDLDALETSRGEATAYRPRKDPTIQKAPKRSFLVDDASTLIYIANLGCIPLHVLAGRAPDLTWADYLTLDFDVKQSELRHAITLARTLHGILDELGLEGFPKTSGQSGLHVLVPLGPKQSFDIARALAELLGRLLVDRHPDIATMERIVARRGPRVYVDTGQTGTGRAIVAPYSVRAVKGATVSAPLAWSEVGPKLDPTAFTIKTMARRIEKRGDLLARLLDAKPDVAGAVDKIARLFT
jgi:bifunctional non-homologous end joining protein LigD